MIPFFNCGNPRDDIDLEEEETDQQEPNNQEDDLDIPDIRQRKQRMRETMTQFKSNHAQPGCLIM